MLPKQVLYSLSHTSSPFCSGYFGDGVQAGLEPPYSLSVSQVVRITGMSHQHLLQSAMVNITLFHGHFATVRLLVHKVRTGKGHVILT
jgi:hypothetical protein